MEENKITLLKSIDGSDKDCHISLTNFPVYGKADGYRLLHSGYISDSIMNSLWRIKGKESIFTEIKGFFRKKHLCPACFNVLNISSLKTDRIATKLSLPEDKIVDFEVSMPMIICNRCGKKLIIRNQKYSFQMEYAILDSFEKYKIK